MLPAGWDVKEFPTKRHDDVTWFYKEDGEPVISVEKGDHRLVASPGGDILIFGEGKTFRASGGNGQGRLTRKLVEKGDYRLNNWFDIQYMDLKKYDELFDEASPVGPCFDEFARTCEDVSYSVSESCEILADAARRIDEGKHPWSDRPFPINFESEPIE
jgi:hypothetical protein